MQSSAPPQPGAGNLFGKKDNTPAEPAAPTQPKTSPFAAATGDSKGLFAPKGGPAAGGDKKDGFWKPEEKKGAPTGQMAAPGGQAKAPTASGQGEKKGLFATGQVEKKTPFSSAAPKPNPLSLNKDAGKPG